MFKIPYPEYSGCNKSVVITLFRGKLNKYKNTITLFPLHKSNVLFYTLPSDTKLQEILCTAIIFCSVIIAFCGATLALVGHIVATVHVLVHK